MTNLFILQLRAKGFFSVFTSTFIVATLLMGCGSLDVAVTIRNDSGQMIKRVVIEPEKGGVIERGKISAGKLLEISVPAAGESSYRLRVELEDGRSLEGGAGYVESGYKVVETVTTSKIDSSVTLGKY